MNRPQTPAPQSAQSTRSLWSEPPAAFRGKPFWAWNGKLEIPELKRQVGVFADMGMGGFFMHSRTGLVTEYLGPEWFEAINVVADEGERQGMEAWIYDEDRWPSGSAGGLATEKESFQMKVLRCRVVESGKIEWPEERFFVAAFEAELNDVHLGDTARIDYQSLSEIKQFCVLVFSWEVLPSSSFYNGNTYLDTMDADAVAHFLGMTHDRYADACGDRLGTSIPGVFTDEPHRGLVMPTEPWAIGPQGGAFTAPWTPKLPEAYHAAFDSDLIQVLPEVFFQKDGEALSPHKWRYMEILQRLFLDHWAKPCRERAHRYDLRLTGHVFHEDNLSAQAIPQGSLARYYPYMDVPGIDVLGNDNTCFWIAKQVQSVARQQNQPWILSELYGCSGWRMTFADHKRMGDWQALFGVNVRCHHLSWYTMAGEAKRDYPASIFFQSSWWREYERVETYFSRLHTVLQAGKPVCDVLVVNPVESFWAQIHPGWSDWLNPGSSRLKVLQAQYETLFQWLQGNRIDFDYGDEDHIAHLSRVVEEVERPSLELGAMRYRTVVVAGCDTLRGSTLEVLEAFGKAGGTVIFAGDPPHYVDALPSDRALRLAETRHRVSWQEEAVIRAISKAQGGSLFTVSGVDDTVFAQVRELEDGWFLVLLNTSETTNFDSVHVDFKGGRSLEQWDALNGDCWSVPVSQLDGVLRWQTQLPAMAERVFHICTSPAVSVPSDVKPAFAPQRVLTGPFAYDIGEPNLLVLDYARFRIDGDDWSERMQVLKVEELLCQRAGVSIRNGKMVQPWAQKSQTFPEAGFQVEMEFDFEVTECPSEPLRLLMEPIEGQMLEVNGCVPWGAEQPQGWMIDPCLTAFVLEPSWLQFGKNTIRLRFDFSVGLDVEALYLAGNFGVCSGRNGGPSQIVTRPAFLETGDVCRQGFPFYGDRIFYKIPVTTEGRLQVQISGGSCVAFQGAGARVVIPWGEFGYRVTEEDVQQGVVTCELILTRRNTFGPLHHSNREMTWVGPSAFRSEGKDWTDNYILISCSLDAVFFEALSP